MPQAPWRLSAADLLRPSPLQACIFLAWPLATATSTWHAIPLPWATPSLPRDRPPDPAPLAALSIAVRWTRALPSSFSVHGRPCWGSAGQLTLCGRGLQPPAEPTDVPVGFLDLLQRLSPSELHEGAQLSQCAPEATCMGALPLLLGLGVELDGTVSHVTHPACHPGRRGCWAFLPVQPLLGAGSHLWPQGLGEVQWRQWQQGTGQAQAPGEKEVRRSQEHS